MPQANTTAAEFPATALEVQELERSRVSRILHDKVGQVLSAIGLQLDLLRMDFKEKTPEIALRTQEIQSLLETAVVEVRNLSYEMDSAMVERSGLSAALERLVDRLRRTLNTELSAAIEPVQLPRLAAIAMHRIASLALENAVRHAHASRISVVMESEAAKTILEVSDNGSGFSVPQERQKPHGHGMALMSYYASQAKVRLQISSGNGKGTTVKAIFTQTLAITPGQRLQLKQ